MKKAKQNRSNSECREVALLGDHAVAAHDHTRCGGIALTPAVMCTCVPQGAGHALRTLCRQSNQRKRQ